MSPGPAQAAGIPQSRPYTDPKSYASAVVVVVLLYFVFWLPGLIANLVYLADAQNYNSRTGHDGDFAGCLLRLLLGMIVLAVIMIVLAMIVWFSGYARLFAPRYS